MKCPRCGHNRFYATQSVHGEITVLVDERGHFLENTSGPGTEKDIPQGMIPSESLDFDNPEGPYECEKCHATVDDLDDGG